MKRIFLSILAVGTALALAAPVWAGGETLSDADLAGIEAAGVEIENSCALCGQYNKEIDVDVDVEIEKSFNGLKASKSEYTSTSTYSKTKNENGYWRDMDFGNGILIGGSVQDNNAVNFIMANGRNDIAAQNNFLMLKGDGSALGATAHGVNQINNAFGKTYVDQSDTTKLSYKSLDKDITGSFNKNYSSSYSSKSSYSLSKHVDVDVNVYKKSVRVVRPPQPCSAP